MIPLRVERLKDIHRSDRQRFLGSQKPVSLLSGAGGIIPWAAQPPTRIRSASWPRFRYGAFQLQPTRAAQQCWDENPLVMLNPYPPSPIVAARVLIAPRKCDLPRPAKSRAKDVHSNSSPINTLDRDGLQNRLTRGEFAAAGPRSNHKSCSVSTPHSPTARCRNGQGKARGGASDWSIS